MNRWFPQIWTFFLKYPSIWKVNTIQVLDTIYFYIYTTAFYIYTTAWKNLAMQFKKVCLFIDHIWYTSLRIFHGRTAAHSKLKYNYFTTFLKQCDEMAHVYIRRWNSVAQIILQSMYSDVQKSRKKTKKKSDYQYTQKISNFVTSCCY